MPEYQDAQGWAPEAMKNPSRQRQQSLSKIHKKKQTQSAALVEVNTNNPVAEADTASLPPRALDASGEIIAPVRFTAMELLARRGLEYKHVKGNDGRLIVTLLPFVERHRDRRAHQVWYGVP